MLNIGIAEIAIIAAVLVVGALVIGVALLLIVRAGQGKG